MTGSIGPMWPCKAHLSHVKSYELEPNYNIFGSVKYFFKSQNVILQFEYL